MPELPVHCCCEPGKHLGWMPCDDRSPSVTYALWARPSLREAPDALLPVEYVTLTKRRLRLDSGREVLAYDSGHQPVEVLRTLRGWRDA